MSHKEDSVCRLQNSTLAQLLLDDNYFGKGRDIAGEALRPMDLSKKGPLLSNPPPLDPICVRLGFTSQSAESPGAQRTRESGNRKPGIGTKPSQQGDTSMTPCKDAVDVVNDLHQAVARELDILSRLPPNRMYGSESRWRCQICPFSAAAPRILYSHYQFHQQLLASGSSSTAHMEWLAAYQRTRGQPGSGEPHIEQSPGDFGDSSSVKPSADSYQSLRNLLSRSPELRQPSATAFLKTMTQTIMPSLREERPGVYNPTTSEQLKIRKGQPTSTTLRVLQDRRSSVLQGNSIVHPPIKVEPDSDQCISEVETRSSSALTDCDSVFSMAGAIRLEPKTSFQEQRNSVASPISIVVATQSKQRLSPPTSTCSLKAEIAQKQYPTTGPAPAAQDIPENVPGYAPVSLLDHMTDQNELTEVEFLPTHLHHSKQLLGKRPYPIHDSVEICSPQRQQLSSASPHVTSMSSVSGPPQTDSPDSAKKLLADVGIQCELLKDSQISDKVVEEPNQELLASSAKATLEQLQEDNCASSSSTPSQKCSHCGIQFEDDVLYSIHMGCHSHRDPFICNVCGKRCGNRYGFYTHIMRGHRR